MTFTQKIFSFLHRNYVAAFIVFSLSLVAVSWYRAFYAETLIVDGHNLNGIYETIGFYFFIIAFGGYCLTYYAVWDKDDISIPAIRKLAYVTVFIFSLMLPMLSNDIFSLIAYGDAANRGYDVYTNTASLHYSVYFGYVSKFWKNAPCVYGPVVLIGARFAAWAGSDNMSLALIAYKVVGLLWSIFFVEAAIMVCKNLDTTPRKLFFIVFSPFFMIQGAAQLHCDAIAAAMAMCAVYFIFTKRWYMAFVFAALCTAVKISYILVFPFLIIGLFFDSANNWNYVRNVVIATVVYCGAFVLVYSGVYHSPDTFKIMFQFVFNQAPSRSLAEVLGSIFFYIPQLWHGNNESLKGAIEGRISNQQLFIWDVIKRVNQLIAIVSAAYLLFNFWFGNRNLKQWFRVYVRLALMFLLLFSHIFYSWYMMLVLPFLWMAEDEDFMKWLFVLSFLIGMQDIVYALSRNSTVYYLAIVITAVSIFAYVFKFHRNILMIAKKPDTSKTT